MKRVYIVVEGQTEQNFVKEILAPYLARYELFQVTPLLITTSKNGKGGFSNYHHLKNTIQAKLKEESSNDAIVVTMIVDFFRIPTNLPNYALAMAAMQRKRQVEILEESISKDISDPRFWAYIQLHEFEALLFSNNRGFENYFLPDQASKTEQIINGFGNPEDINTTPEGAPSKRIIAIRTNYDKVVEGNVIALDIGIDSILERCPRFRSWVEEIIRRASL